MMEEKTVRIPCAVVTVERDCSIEARRRYRAERKRVVCCERIIAVLGAVAAAGIILMFAALWKVWVI